MTGAIPKEMIEKLMVAFSDRWIRAEEAEAVLIAAGVPALIEERDAAAKAIESLVSGSVGIPKAWTIGAMTVASAVDSILDATESFCEDSERAFSKDRAQAVIHAAIWAYQVRRGSTSSAYAFANLIASLGVKRWSFKDDWSDITINGAVVMAALDRVTAERDAAIAERDAAIAHASDLQRSQGYRYIGKDRKMVLARDLEDQRDAALSRIETLEEALKPFAKSGELFAPREPHEYDHVIYKPSAGDEYSLCGDDLRRARSALNNGGENG